MADRSRFAAVAGPVARPLAWTLALCLFAAVRLDAAMVSFLVIETGLPEEREGGRHSGLWESGLLDVFYEAGHIVSNAPVLRLPHKPNQEFPDEARADLAEALEGGAEFFILALLEYDAPAQGNAGGAASAPPDAPGNISLRVFRAEPRTLLYQQQYTNTGSMNLKDEYDSVKKAARTLVPHINGR
jgi:hypothetical protein